MSLRSDIARLFGVAALACFGVAAGTGAALASCESGQFPLETFDDEAMRAVLIPPVIEAEAYFDVQFSAYCVDTNIFGAYVNLETGALVLGERFMEELANKNLNQVAGVIAHETAHWFQAKHKVLEALTMNDKSRVKCIELHADFLAGGFMRWRSKRVTVDPVQLAETFFDLGDPYVHDFDHHGLNAERALAFSAGYQNLFDNVADTATLGNIYVSLANCDPT